MRLKCENVERVSEDAAVIDRLKREGFKEVTGINANAIVVSEEKPAELSEMKVDALRAFAKEKGIEGYSSLTKAELLDVLKDVV